MRIQGSTTSRSVLVRERLRARQARRAEDELFVPEPGGTEPQGTRAVRRAFLARPWGMTPSLLRPRH
ncbi:hypothetical protein EMQ25_09025 [Arsenicitalea aurantiaca]|uniref:Uncharacterized protein n=1 Tax=Arsenicitalea aurantiaca TaxID=1783274 RepID=A0A433XA98_9HYPH|nr:hypothetical protein [Arsenicitalea aurantiaca]RUT31011.1 hypothetical protein EMQ25_09025 [Arsenicitalea aurantiaca]